MRNRILSIIFLLAAAFTVQAQGVSKGYTLLSDVSGKTATQKQADTISAATTTKTQTAKIEGFWNSVSVQVELNRISGTANGKVILYGSLNGSSYEKVDSLATVYNVAQQTKVFQSVPSKYVWYRVTYTTGSGTQSVAFKSYAVARKQ